MRNVGYWAAHLDDLFPRSWAEAWDNPGLQVGDPAATVVRIMVALDATAEVIEEASGSGAQMLVTHHPLIFEPLLSIDAARPVGAAVAEAIRRGVNVFACHTNADVASPGVSDALAEELNVSVEGALMPSSTGGLGLGRVGSLGTEKTAGELAEVCAGRLGGRPRLIGDVTRAVKRVALCGGSGAQLISHALDARADVFVTGDVRHHDGLEALSAGLTVIDAGHFPTEWPFVARLAGRLESAGADVSVSGLSTDPFGVGS